MTTTLPDPATGTDAGTRGGSAVVDLHAEAARLAAMPRSWTPSVSELLEEESRSHDAYDARPVARPLASRSPHPSLTDLDHVLDALAVNDAHLATLHSERATLLAHAIHLAEALETDLLDPDDPTAARAPSARRLELARRAVTAEIATTLHLGEHATGTLTDHAVTLTDKAPATMKALHDGRLTWAHATAITTHLADLTPTEALAVERTILNTVLEPDPDDGTGPGTITCTPAQVARRARRARDVAHPVPADVRHTQAAQHRAVFLDDAPDGMAWLTAHLPAPLAHAAYDRLTRTARHLTTGHTSRGTGAAGEREQRTLAQARADTLTALLLDDGTLDLAATPGSRPRQPTQRRGKPDDRHDGESNEHTATHPDTEADANEETDPGGEADDRLAVLLHEQNALATLARSIRPQVTVTVPVLTLLGVTDAPATMNGHVPIDPDTARRLTALAPSLRRVLTHPETGTVLSAGRTTYTVPADLKALIRHRDTTCRFPGCTHPATTSDLDHTIPWATGGTTDADNLAALCRRHHVTKHQTTWQVRHVRQVDPGRDDHPTDWGGTLEWTSPTGRRYLTRPEPLETTRHRHAPEGPDLPEVPESGPPDHGPDGPPGTLPNDPPF